MLSGQIEAHIMKKGMLGFKNLLLRGSFFCPQILESQTALSFSPSQWTIKPGNPLAAVAVVRSPGWTLWMGTHPPCFLLLQTHSSGPDFLTSFLFLAISPRSHSCQSSACQSLMALIANVGGKDTETRSAQWEGHSQEVTL